MLDDPFGFDLMNDDAEAETENMQNTFQETHQTTESTITDEAEAEKNNSSTGVEAVNTTQSHPHIVITPATMQLHADLRAAWPSSIDSGY